MYDIIECKGHAVIRYLKAIGWRPEPKKKPVDWGKMRIWETTATGSLESMAKFFGGRDESHDRF